MRKLTKAEIEWASIKERAMYRTLKKFPGAYSDNVTRRLKPRKMKRKK